ncbi:MAG: transporter, partial [Burkholderiaceae bacterium]
AKADQIGMDCNAAGPCEKGKPGGMVPIEPSDADKAQLNGIVQDFVLARWAKRCGEACAKEWNETVGKVVGMTAKSK